jgi:hypothetical protein
MTTFVLSLPLIAVAWILPIVPTHAQPNPAFVAAKGSDSNPCTIALPCRSFQHAHDVIAANGEIDVLDPGAGYGSLNITKSISIQGHGFASIIVSAGVSGIAIHAGASDAVSLNGLLIDGAGTGATGIAFFSGSSLVVKNCVLRKHIASGIAIVSGAPARVAVSDTVSADNGEFGFLIQPAAGLTGTVFAVLNRVEAYHNGKQGIGVYGNLISGNSRVETLVLGSVAANNGQSGIYALGSKASVRVARSTTYANPVNFHSSTIGTGVVADATSIVVSESNIDDLWDQPNAGCVMSYGDNYTPTIPPSCVTLAKH